MYLGIWYDDKALHSNWVAESGSAGQQNVSVPLSLFTVKQHLEIYG